MARLGRIRHNINRAWDESKVRRDRIGRFAPFDAIADLVGRDPTAASPDEYKKRLEALGIRAVEFRNGAEKTKIPRLASQGMKEALRAGIPAPWGIFGQKNPNPMASPDAVASYQESGRLIQLNAKSPYWKHPQSYAEKFEEMAFWASPLAAGPVHHEMAHHGHAENLKDLGGISFEKFYYKPVPSSARYEVSEYADENLGEFVAETFAGMMSGKVYPPEVMEVYDWSHGPVMLRPAVGG